MWPRAFCAVALLTLGGCSGMSEQACLVSDWRTVGFEDGAAGLAAASIGRYRQACAEHGVSPDLDSYLAGHAEGVELYCRPAQGFNSGRAGRSYQGVCPANSEPAFLAAYNSGHRLFELESAVRSADAEIARNVKTQEDIKHELTNIGVTMAATETTTEERLRLVARITELGQKHGELTTRSNTLREERGRHQAELDAYRETLAFEF